METTARCTCGALEIQVSGPPVAQLTCHCRQCQAFSGKDFVEGAFFSKDSCQIKGQTTADVQEGGTGSPKIHHSCASCGAPMYVQVEALNGAIAIMAERLDPFAFASEVHVWTSEKAPDTDIPSGVRQSAGAPPPDIARRMIKACWAK